ncbi:MAG TPA: diaminopimelate dehydrogenase [Salinisphaeraceae bacterium]|nr:diaminopimelate dehydrogenase [Salinisphaeraceae bacterium]
MSDAIRIGILGYGNLGRGVELAVANNADMALVGIFTRREPSALQPQLADSAVLHVDALDEHRDSIDVLILCGGSKDDLPQQGPACAAHFNTVDSFDTHARIPEYFASVDAVAGPAGHTALISCGWDPGLFSLNRVMGEALVPDGATYTFWGRGLSQGHSDALRQVPGVAAGVQYTIPAEDAMDKVRSGARPELSTRAKHRRECYVVLEEGADADEVRTAITTMAHYFEPYDTTVHFISADELAHEHSAMPHGGFVIHSGNTSDTAVQTIEYRLQLGSNPQFTASVLTTYARAVHRLSQAGQHGAITVYDVPPGLLSPKSAAVLRRDYL